MAPSYVQEIWTHTEITMLIRLYEERPMLWDIKHKDYYNKAIRCNANRSISEALDRSGKSVEMKFRSLRAYYLDQLKKQKMDPDYSVKWPYFMSMQFLLESCIAMQLKISQKAQNQSDHDLPADSSSSQPQQINQPPTDSQQPVTDLKIEPPFGEVDHDSIRIVCSPPPPPPPTPPLTTTSHSDHPLLAGTSAELDPTCNVGADNEMTNSTSQTAMGESMEQTWHLSDDVSDRSSLLTHGHGHAGLHYSNHLGHLQSGSQYRGFAEFVEHSLRQLHPRLQAEAFLDVHKLLFDYQTRSCQLFDSNMSSIIKVERSEIE